MRVELTKVYLIQVLDENGYEMASEYLICDRATALEHGKQMKEALKDIEGGSSYEFYQ